MNHQLYCIYANALDSHVGIKDVRDIITSYMYLREQEIWKWCNALHPFKEWRYRRWSSRNMLLEDIAWWDWKEGRISLQVELETGQMILGRNDVYEIVFDLETAREKVMSVNGRKN